MKENTVFEDKFDDKYPLGNVPATRTQPPSSDAG